MPVLNDRQYPLSTINIMNIYTVKAGYNIPILAIDSE